MRWRLTSTAGFTEQEEEFIGVVEDMYARMNSRDQLLSRIDGLRAEHERRVAAGHHSAATGKPTKPKTQKTEGYNYFNL